MRERKFNNGVALRLKIGVIDGYFFDLLVFYLSCLIIVRVHEQDSRSFNSRSLSFQAISLN